MIYEAENQNADFGKIQRIKIYLLIANENVFFRKTGGCSIKNFSEWFVGDKRRTLVQKLLSDKSQKLPSYFEGGIFQVNQWLNVL